MIDSRDLGLFFVGVLTFFVASITLILMVSSEPEPTVSPCTAEREAADENAEFLVACMEELLSCYANEVEYSL